MSIRSTGKRLGRFRVKAPDPLAVVLAERRVGRYVVQAVRLFADVCHRILLDGWQLETWYDSDVARVPRTCLRVGPEMVQALGRGETVPDSAPQLALFDDAPIEKRPRLFGDAP